jgi:hypothetical protein
MSSLKFTQPTHWDRIHTHLAAAAGERFAFALTTVLSPTGTDGPILQVVDVMLIDDSDVDHDTTGWYIANQALDRVHNQAVRTGCGLVEFHNHRFGPPGFSHTDEAGLAPTVAYLLDLLPHMTYGAAVWADGALHAEWWRPTGDIARGVFRTVTVLGEQLRVLNAAPIRDERFARQLPLLGAQVQGAIRRLRVAVVGAGGTGSHLTVNLAYLGFRDVVVLDDDTVEQTNLNRLVTAELADIGTPKNTVARRRMRGIDPNIKVQTMPALTPTGAHPELHDVDLIIGCVDDDGPRQRLNQIAIDSRTPYIDIATGVDARAQPAAIGGRVVLVIPGGPCLTCHHELDSAEIARWAKTTEQRALDREHGYGTGIANPSVVHLNGITVNAALAELIAWLSGARQPAQFLDIDLVGRPAHPGLQIGPRQARQPDVGCIDCVPSMPLPTTL